MNDIHPTQDGPVAVATLLLFVQGAIAVAASAEAIGMALASGGASAVSALLTVAGATATLILVARLSRRRRSARRWVMALQVGWVSLAAIDLALALAIAGRGLSPTGFLVRMVLPMAIFWLLRRPAAKAEFKDGEDSLESVKERPTEESWELEEVWA